MSSSRGKGWAAVAWAGGKAGTSEGGARAHLWIADGPAAGAFRHGTTSLRWLLMPSSGKGPAGMERRPGLLVARRVDERVVSVDTRKPGLHWRQIPLPQEHHPRPLELQL